ncbi:hypothetical protein MKX01_021122, partial [Papaver californicum]
SILFWSMLEVFIGNKISKEELAKKNHSLELLLKSYTKASDRNSGFKFGAGSRVFVSTPSDRAVIFGLQLIKSGIENKLLYECKITPITNDLYQKYNFGEAKATVIRSTGAQVDIIDAISNGE